MSKIEIVDIRDHVIVRAKELAGFISARLDTNSVLLSSINKEIASKFRDLFDAATVITMLAMDTKDDSPVIVEIRALTRKCVDIMKENDSLMRMAVSIRNNDPNTVYKLSFDQVKDLGLLRAGVTQKEDNNV